MNGAVGKPTGLHPAEWAPQSHMAHTSFVLQQYPWLYPDAWRQQSHTYTHAAAGTHPRLFHTHTWKTRDTCCGLPDNQDTAQPRPGIHRTGTRVTKATSELLLLPIQHTSRPPRFLDLGLQTASWQHPCWNSIRKRSQPLLSRNLSLKGKPLPSRRQGSQSPRTLDPGNLRKVQSCMPVEKPMPQ